MRLCRFTHAGRARWGIYEESTIVAVDQRVGAELREHLVQSWEDALPLGSDAWSALHECLQRLCDKNYAGCERLSTAAVELLPPIARPPKLFLLAGNYGEHVLEQGGLTAEKERTFPYVFMKPPSTTLVGSGRTFAIPANSPSKLDHEVELGVIIGRRIRNASASSAADAIVGYTIINDISDRSFRPNSNRVQRPRDSFFDWLHGKWHDGSCPCGPCVVLAQAVPDVQELSLSLRIDGEVRQQGSTAQMIMTVTELIEFISSFVTLEPGDIISTGTPSGVGNASGRYLQPGQTMVAEIDGIGQLVTPVSG